MYILVYFNRDELKVANEFAKYYKVPERRFLLTRVKVLIENKNFDELERLLADKNKKTPIIPYELVADLLIRAGQEDRGLAMIMKMPDVEVIYWQNIFTINRNKLIC